GQARKVAGTAKADEGLLRLGQTSMMVSLDFSCNKEFYRVRREYTHSTKAYTSLDFGIVDQTTGAFKPLTDKTIRATQEKLEATIGLDFDSFVNSAFIRQGQSNEFSKKSPKDRKEILATILGLGQFELLRKKASDRSRQSAQQKEYLSTLCQRLAQEIEQNQSLELKLQEATNALTDLQTQELTFKRALQDTVNQQQALAPAKIKRDTLNVQQQEIARSIKEYTSTLLTEIACARSTLKKQRATVNYQKLEEERLHINQELQQIQLKGQERITLKEAYLHKKQELTSYEHMIEVQHATVLEQFKTTQQYCILFNKEQEYKIKELAEQCQRDTRELIKLEEHSKSLENTSKLTVSSAAFTQLENQFDKRKAAYHKFIAQGNLLKSELASIKHKKELSHNANNPLCPLCEQDLSQEKKHVLSSALEKTEQRYTWQLARLTKIIKNLKEVIVAQHTTLEKQRADAQEAAIRQVQLEDATKNKVKIQESLLQKQKLVFELNKELALSLEQLKNKQQEQAAFEKQAQTYKVQDSVYTAIISQLDELSKKLDALSHDTVHETALNTRLQHIVALQQDHAQTTKETILKDQRKYTISSTVKSIKLLKHKSQEIALELALCNSLLEDDYLLAQKETDLHTILLKIAHQKEQLMHHKGALEQQQKFFEQRASEYKNYQTTIKELEKTSEEYHAIAQALSKDGIQALLIEDAIPEIEHEANILLSRLTDNQAQLSIESLRDLRSGGTKETLDIKISDTVGVRPYELFSGGEAFRIDFALRIAISKLLARRAGTALQTLIIDEGFGSQDDEGLAHIMESLYKIQEDFAKIIIVSHLPALKDQFPVHFLVHKSSQGSTVKVIEQG
ncbi:SMC family ATPase, partial [Candidatus Dependentiae bacterium]|nr:SMC family ATPase [Candidatus Dependentiae bacterium]